MGVVVRRYIDFILLIPTPLYLFFLQQYIYTVFPRNSSRAVTICVMRGQFEGALYSRARFNSTDHAAKPRHIGKLDRKFLMQEVLV